MSFKILHKGEWLQHAFGSTGLNAGMAKHLIWVKTTLWKHLSKHFHTWLNFSSVHYQMLQEMLEIQHKN